MLHIGLNIARGVLRKAAKNDWPEDEPPNGRGPRALCGPGPGKLQPNADSAHKPGSVETVPIDNGGARAARCLARGVHFNRDQLAKIKHRVIVVQCAPLL